MTIPEFSRPRRGRFPRRRGARDRPPARGGPQVLATGGGAFMNAETRAAISAKGVSVWLKADFDVLMRRVQAPHRPAAAARPTIRRETLRDADRRALSGLCAGRRHGAVARRAARQDRRRDRRALAAHLRSRAARRDRKACHDRAAAQPTRPIVSTSRSATRSYDIVIGRGLLAVARRAHRGAAAAAPVGIVTDDNVARPSPRRRRGVAGARPASRRRQRRSSPPGESSKSLRRASSRSARADRRAHRARRSRGGARRRRHRRSRRLRRRGGAARPRLRAGADHAAGAGRFLGRRQDRDQFRPRQEPDRRLPPAEPGARRHRRCSTRCRRANSAPAMPRSPNTA